MYTLQIFFIKGTLFGWELFVIFLATPGQRLLGAARARTQDSQISSLIP